MTSVLYSLVLAVEKTHTHVLSEILRCYLRDLPWPMGSEYQNKAAGKAFFPHLFPKQIQVHSVGTMQLHPINLPTGRERSLAAVVQKTLPRVSEQSPLQDGVQAL